MLAALVLAALSATATPAERETAPPQQWVIPTTRAEQGVALEAWLLVAGSGEATATLFQPRGARVWWAMPSCREPAKRYLVRRVAAGRVYGVCGVVDSDAPFRFAARIEYDSGTGALSNSDAVPLEKGAEIPPTLLAVFGVIGGWIVGLLTPILQSAIDQWFKLRKSRYELVNHVVKDIAPSLGVIRTQLEQYVAAPNATVQVSEAVYLNMTDEGPFAIVDAATRATYFSKFKALHEKLLEFNRSAVGSQPAIATAAARDAVAKIDKLMKG